MNLKPVKNQTSQYEEWAKKSKKLYPQPEERGFTAQKW